MTETTAKELKLREKQEVSSPAEQTRPGRVFTPNVDIFETDKELTLLADMPGVEAEDLSIDLREDVLTLSGEVRPVEKAAEEPVILEYDTGKYYRQFTLSEIIDQSRIEANFTDGVLRLALPKVAKATPRKVPVQVA